MTLNTTKAEQAYMRIVLTWHARIFGAATAGFSLCLLGAVTALGPSGQVFSAEVPGNDATVHVRWNWRAVQAATSGDGGHSGMQESYRRQIAAKFAGAGQPGPQPTGGEIVARELADGTMGARLPVQHLNVAVVHRDADGRLVVSCEQAADKAAGAAPAHPDARH